MRPKKGGAVSMLKIGGVKLGEVPRVVLAVDGESPAAAQAAEEGVDILEARVDLFSGSLTSASVVDEVKVLKRHEMPLIGTIRAQRERGKAKLSDAQRAALYQHISPLVDAIDVDVSDGILKPVVAWARRNKNTVILSHHDFHGTPSEATLERVVRNAAALGADVIKVATLAKDERDVVRLLQFTAAHRRKNLVTITMGNIGSVSRLLFPLVGSLMTYTNVSPSDGQIPVKRLIEDLRFYCPRYNEALISRLGLSEDA
ncbi:MAG: type I 3-dehydroquinate dehydratase [Candidatus Omnitrophica bacterium]|nr:type I 3-dehydroquinate dehydratase [Candidatus Omnitrophota bacterium]